MAHPGIHRVLHLALATVFLASIFAGIAPLAAAQSSTRNDMDCNTPLSGWIFNVGPYQGQNKYKETFAGPAQEHTFRTLRLQLRPDAAATIASVVIEADRRSPTQYIEFDGSPSSSATGFTKAEYQSFPTGSPTHTAPHDLLVFSGANIQGTSGADFKVSFSVKGNPPAGTVFPINVTMYEPDAATGHRCTVLTSMQSSFLLTIDNKPPAMAEPGRPPWNATIHDTNFDGHIDQVVMRFNESMELKTFHLEQFNFTRTIGGFERVYQPLPGQVFWDADHKKLTLGLAALAYFDTGDMPEIKYRAPPDGETFTDLAGNKLPNYNMPAAKVNDKARPVLISALGYVDATEMLLTFSEPVGGSGDAPPSGCPAGSPNQVLRCDLVYTNAGPVTGLTDNVRTLADFSNTPGTQLAWSTTVRLPLAVGSTPTRFGTQDVDFTQGDRVAVAPRSGGGPCTDVPPPCTRIYDRVGNTVVTAGQYERVKVSSPTVVQAEVNIDSRKVTLQFNGPVSDIMDDKVGVGPRAIDVVTTTGGAPGGIDDIQHGAGTPYVIATLDERVKPTDVDNTPSYIRINCDPSKGSPYSFIKATGLPASITVPCGNYPLVDHTPPAILPNTGLSTVDLNHNGYIDGFAVEFSEPIDDSSFCMGVNPCPSVFAACNNPNVTLAYSCSQHSAPKPCTVDNAPGCTKLALHVSGLDPSTPFRFVTGEHVNDRYGFITWPEVFNVPGTPPATNPHYNRRYTDFVPNLLTFQYFNPNRTGLFHDLVANGTTVNMMYNITDEQCARCNVVVERDTAPPVILLADTYDTKLAPECAEGNGRLDGYKLTFSEAIRDNTFTISEWSVAGHRVTAGLSGEPCQPVSQSILANDNIFIVKFDEIDFDTSAKPQLTYTLGRGPTAPSGLKDLQFNAMRSFLERDLNETDRARPVIVSVVGFPGQDWLTVNFSEPVDNGAGGPLIWDDFFYANVFKLPGDPPPEASGRATGPNAPQAQHTAGSLTIRLPLNRPLHPYDIRNDTVNAVHNMTREVAPSLPAHERQSISTVRHAILPGVDFVPPGDITGLRVEGAATNANSVTLSWVAPGDDRVPPGVPLNTFNAHGLVSDYTVKMREGEEPVNRSNFDSIRNPAGISVTFIRDRTGAPGLAAPGERQTVLIVGLKPGTKYTFGVRACDERMANAVPPVIPPGEGCTAHLNLGNATDGDRQPVFAETARDETGPVGDLTISSTSHRKNTPSINRVVQLNWTKLEDPESVVVYHYVLNRDPAFQFAKPQFNMTAARTATLQNVAEGTWTFHVAGYSGGKFSRTAHYTIVIGHAPLRPDDIKAANLAIEVQVTRERGVNTVNWTLPPLEYLPRPGATLQKLQIWRLDDGVVGAAPIAEIPGTYQALATGTYTDNTEGATKDSAYRVDMVFERDQAMTNPEQSYEGFQRTTNLDRPGWSLLAKVFLGIAIALLLVAGIILAVVLRRRSLRKAAATGPTQGYTYQAPPSAAVDPATGMPIHDVRCPSCSTEFQAQGQMPLQIACPNCGVSGILQ